MLVALACLMTFYFISTAFLLWWTATVMRRQCNSDLQWHREILLRHMENQLASHESSLVDRLRHTK